MYQLDREIETGKVLISTAPCLVGELQLTFPMYDEIGRVSGNVPMTLTSGRIVDLLETFTAKQIQNSESLINAIRNGDVILHLNS